MKIKKFIAIGCLHKEIKTKGQLLSESVFMGLWICGLFCSLANLSKINLDFWTLIKKYK